MNTIPEALIRLRSAMQAANVDPEGVTIQLPFPAYYDVWSALSATELLSGGGTVPVAFKYMGFYFEQAPP